MHPGEMEPENGPLEDDDVPVTSRRGCQVVFSCTALLQDEYQTQHS